MFDAVMQQPLPFSCQQGNRPYEKYSQGNNIWVGNARIRMRINNGLQVELRIGKKTIIHANGIVYSLLFHELTPRPKSGLPTDPAAYEATIVISGN